MLSRWISLLGLRREQPKTRRAKETVKPGVEELVQRILLSASTPNSPQLAEVTTQITAMMEQTFQLIETVDQDLINIYDTYTNYVAHVEASAALQWEQFLGIAPPMGGSGSGSGTVTTTNDAADQPPVAMQPKPGSGTGSGATTSHENSPVIKMHPLTSGSGSGSVQFGSQDTLEWKPAGSGVIPWIDLSKGSKRLGGPTPTNPVIFDGSVSNTPITWAASVASITIRNGYNAVMTIPGDSLLTDNGTIVVDAQSKLNVYFESDSMFEVDGGGTITNMILDGSNEGTFVVNGGTMTIDPNPGGYTENLGVNLTVTAGAILKYGNYDTLQLTSNNVVITVSGEMDTYWGSNNQNTMIGGGAANPNDYINVSDGTLVYYGRQNIADTITVPIALNGGTLKVTVDPASGKPLQGKLIVQGGNVSTNNVSVYMHSYGYVKLDNYDTLECDNGYYQDAGFLQTLDDTECTLQAGGGGAGTATIARGELDIDLSQKGDGKLDVRAATLNFNGELGVSIAIKQPTTSDILNVSGTINLQPKSTLSVSFNEIPPADNQWVIIDAANAIQPIDFVMPLTTFPNRYAWVSGKVNPDDNTQYIVID